MDTPITSIYRDPLCLIVEKLTDYTDLINFLISQPRLRADLARSCVREILTDRSKLTEYGTYPNYNIGVVYSFPNLNTFALPLICKTEQLQLLGLHPSLRNFEVTLSDYQPPEILGVYILAFLQQYTGGTYDLGIVRYINNRTLQGTDIRIREEGSGLQVALKDRNAYLNVDLDLDDPERTTQILLRAGITDVWSEAENTTHIYATNSLHTIFRLDPGHQQSILVTLRDAPNITRGYAYFFMEERRSQKEEAFNELIEYNMGVLSNYERSFDKLIEFTFPLKPLPQLERVISKFPNVSRFVILLDSPEESRSIPSPPQGKFFDIYFHYGGPSIPLYETSAEVFYEEIGLNIEEL